jgi:hypothetical protein
MKEGLIGVTSTKAVLLCNIKNSFASVSFNHLLLFFLTISTSPLKLTIESSPL